MATDFAYAAFFFPVLICIGLVLVLAIGTPVQAYESPLGLGRVRLARGYLGAMLATFLYAVVTATHLGIGKVALGHITQHELRSLLLGYILYFFAEIRGQSTFSREYAIPF